MMTDTDIKEREKIVKSMKKNFKDFRNRYGKRAKDVMYATATKMSMKEETSEEKGEYDYEGDMAKSSLKTIIRNAQVMHDMLSKDTNLPEWVQGKITLAEDYIVSATQYMQSEMKENVNVPNKKVDSKETPKVKYKKMRSQERFDARFKEVDDNYPYRSDN
jgi:serine protease inhibitor